MCLCDGVKKQDTRFLLPYCGWELMSYLIVCNGVIYSRLGSLARQKICIE